MQRANEYAKDQFVISINEQILQEWNIDGNFYQPMAKARIHEKLTQAISNDIEIKN